MNQVKRALGVALLGALIPAAAFAAHPAGMQKHVMLHATKHVMSMKGFMHVTGSASIRYSGHDAFISVTTDNLPAPHALGKMAYVAFVSDKRMTERVGALHTNGMMAGVSGQVMMSKVTDVYVYATSSMAAKHPAGTLVLSAMVG